MRARALLRAAGLPDDGPATRLSGGQMGEVWRIGEHVVKLHDRAPPGLYPAEARGLRALAAAGVRVPDVRWSSDDGIVLSWLGEGPADWPALGGEVARLHGVVGDRYGADGPVFLGRFPLPSGEAETAWPRFFGERRLKPLLRATRGALGPLGDAVERVIDTWRPAVEGPVLLHGDLWSGNVVHGASGPALIDPSVWWGERAVDLAMMELFGGFPRAFWEAYEAERPIGADVRRSIPYHQLYYLLVHVHFFGGAYLSGVRRAVEALDGRS